MNVHKPFNLCYSIGFSLSLQTKRNQWKTVWCSTECKYPVQTKTHINELDVTNGEHKHPIQIELFECIPYILWCHLQHKNNTIQQQIAISVGINQKQLIVLRNLIHKPPELKQFLLWYIWRMEMWWLTMKMFQKLVQ